MTPRAWVALCSCFLVFGGLIGWAARTHTTHDRYMYGLARQYEAAENYYNGKLVNMINDNNRKLQRTKP